MVKRQRRIGFAARAIAIAAIAALPPVVVSGHALAYIGTGTAGGDYFWGSNATDTYHGLAGTDYIFGRGGNDNLFGDEGIDIIALGSGRDVVHGGLDGDFIVDDDGKSSRREKPDQIFGDEGNDTIHSADGEADTIDCGTGDDLAIADGIDNIKGCEFVLSHDGEIFLGLSFEQYPYHAGTKVAETMTGTAASEYISGKNGNDVVLGLGAADTAFAGKGKDRVEGGDAGDLLFDDDSKPGDTLFGGAGNDYFYASDGAADTIDCGDGTDYAFTDGPLLDTVASNCENVYRPPTA
jgi:Ca2+-binding RTX toxin-like protein